MNEAKLRAEILFQKTRARAIAARAEKKLGIQKESATRLRSDVQAEYRCVPVDQLWRGVGSKERQRDWDAIRKWLSFFKDPDVRRHKIGRTHRVRLKSGRHVLIDSKAAKVVGLEER